MLYIEKYDKSLNCREFSFDGDTEVFHKALRYVIRGEYRFHVINHKDENFDLVYKDNDYEMEHTEGFKKMFFTDYYRINGLFLKYDETKRERLILDYFDKFDDIYFNRLNEYTIVLCKILLKYSNKKIIFNDKRIFWFFEDPRIVVTEDFPKEPGISYMIVCTNFLEQSLEVGLGKVYDIILFNAVFLLDTITDLEVKDIKYVVFYIDKVEGMGALIINYLKAKNIFEKFGFKVFIKEGSSRFNDTLLQKYFKIYKLPNDANESNTIYIPNYFGAIISCAFMALNIECDFNEIVKDEYVAQMEEYRQAVFGDKKVLGLMVRGTDYQKNMITQQPIANEKLIELVNKTMEKESYDIIFLATEDYDKLKDLFGAFKGKVVAIAQERYSLKDFSNGIKLISEIEQLNKTKEEQENIVDDTTINYFYAIYILSKCDGFLATPLTNGVRCVQMFNKGKFSYSEILNDII